MCGYMWFYKDRVNMPFYEYTNFYLRVFFRTVFGNAKLSANCKDLHISVFTLVDKRNKKTTYSVKWPLLNVLINVGIQIMFEDMCQF